MTQKYWSLLSPLYLSLSTPALLPQFVLHANSPPMYLPSLISVRLPSVIHFTCLPFIFGTLSRVPYAPRPPSGYWRVVFSSTYLTSIRFLIHALESLWSQCWSGSPWAPLSSCFWSIADVTRHVVCNIVYYLLCLLVIARS